MNIVYTINGEGMGHASRSSVVIGHLIAQGHNVTIFSAGERPLTFLRDRFGSVAEVLGLHMVYQDNKVRRLKTMAKALSNMSYLRKDMVHMREILGPFKPDVVITDFDFHGQIVSSLFQIPIISIDNIQYITQAKFKVATEDYVDYELSYLVAKMMVPHSDYSYITTFARQPQLRNPDAAVEFVPPLLREKVRTATPTIGDHVLVYQTSDSYKELGEVMSKVQEHFIVYNCHGRSLAGNIESKKFDEDSFIRDLATAKAVIVNGGFTTITESLFLGKPVLSIPIKNHYEQKLNGIILQEMGMGVMTERLTLSTLREFLRDLAIYRAATATLQFDNTKLFHKLDSVLARIADHA